MCIRDSADRLQVVRVRLAGRDGRDGGLAGLADLGVLGRRAGVVLRALEVDHVAEAAGPGATKWGKLKSGAGWISLDYTKKV